MVTEIGLDAQWLLPTGGAGTYLAKFVVEAEQAAIDYLGIGDHISFRNGHGFDGLINAMAILASAPRMQVHVGAYLLPARHPVLVARQLATISELAPGRLSIAFGVGGEDPQELWICGVDPTTRGARADEALEILRGLMSGEPTSFAGRHFNLDDARITPAPTEPIPFLIAGRSDAAVERTARIGDGWHGLWVSPNRYAGATARIRERASELGREILPEQNALTVWCGVETNGNNGRQRAREMMEPFYGLPFEKFERYVPVGTPAAIAEQLAPYLAAGCQMFTLVTPGLDAREAIAATAEIGALLRT